MFDKRIIEKIARIAKNPNNVRFKDLSMICDYFFGKPRQKSTSHHVYKTPWKGDPRVNIQNNHGKAKVYQVRQVMKAIKKMEEDDDAKK